MGDVTSEMGRRIWFLVLAKAPPGEHGFDRRTSVERRFCSSKRRGIRGEADR